MSGHPAPSARSVAASLARGRWWIATSTAVSAALTWWLVASTPTLWMSAARLAITDPGETPSQIVARIRSGAVLERLRNDDALTMRLAPGLDSRPGAMARFLTEHVQTSAGAGPEVWITAWHVDGDLAHDLLTAVLAATAVVDAEDRARRADTEIARLEPERQQLVARLEAMAGAAGSPATTSERWLGVVGEEVDRARARRLAEQLAAVEAELEAARATSTEPGTGWYVADAPAAWQHPLPRRLGAPVVAALTLPVLVAALTWLVHDHRRP